MLRVSGVLLSFILTWQASAATFDFVPGGAGNAGVVRTSLNAGNYRRALEAWTTELASTPYAQTADGRALYALILERAGLSINATMRLTRETRPNQLSAPLLKVWTEDLNASRFVTEGWVSTKGPWAAILDNSELNLRLNAKADVPKALARVIALPKAQTIQRARGLWQIATKAPALGDLNAALRALELLRASDQKIIGADMLALTAGRVLYQKGDLDGAVHAFDEVTKDSNLWVTALEERAWASLRRDDYDRALGHVTTLLSPALDSLVGPEPYFLSNLMSLKSCDYTRLFKTSDLFKTRHRARLSQMQELATKGANQALPDALARLDKNGVSVASIGPAIASIPRAALRDRRVRAAFETRKQLLNEAKLATELKDERTSLLSLKRADELRTAGVKRLQTLAQDEVVEYRRILNKLHILEAEVIERLNLDENLKGKRGTLAKTEAHDSNVMVFPYNSDEVWLDELDNYHARVKDCPTLKGAGL